MNYSLIFYRQAENAKIKQEEREEQGREGQGGRARKRIKVEQELVRLGGGLIIDLTD